MSKAFTKDDAWEQLGITLHGRELLGVTAIEYAAP